MIKILILCTGNSCRSQMAHGILDSLLNKKATVFSAGVAPEKVNPYAVSVMKMIGIDISEYKSNHVSEYSEFFFDYVFTVCDSAKDKCPVHFKARKIIHKSFIDPASAKGTEDEILSVYTEVRDKLSDYFINFFKT